MKKFKITWWGRSVTGFFLGLVSMFLLMVMLIPKQAVIGNPSDITIRETAFLFGIMAIVFLVGPALLVTAWRHRKNRSTMAAYLIPGLLLTIFFFLFFFGGFIVAPFV